MGNRVRLTVAAVSVLVLGVPLLAGCTAAAPSRTTTARLVDEPVSTAVISVTPTLAATKVPVTAEIGANVVGGVLTAVTLTDPAGASVPGAMRGDGSTWVPSTALQFDTRYTATIVATAPNGAQKVTTSSFTTMAKPDTKPINASVNVASKTTYGTGMPIMIQFSSDIPQADRAAIERRLYVRSIPAQTGIWSWQAADQVVYRPQSVWQTGTTVTLNTEIAGLPVGNRLISGDHAVTFTIGKDLEYMVNAKTHYMTITSDGKVIKKYPISAGRPSLPSWTGNFVIIQKYYYTVFNTLGIPGENYVTPVNYAERLTWSGTYLHSAPWSVGAQGHTNVSHGCINLPPSGAKWIYENSHVGDRVDITGTDAPVALGNGWTAWTQDWTDFAKGSAVGFANDALTQGATPAI